MRLMPDFKPDWKEPARSLLTRKSRMHVLGYPVYVNPEMPPGVVKFVATNGEEVVTGVSVRWLYEAAFKVRPRFRVDAFWVARHLDDIKEPLKREGIDVRHF